MSLTLQTVKTTQAQLIENEKMATLGLLTSGIAHEINNPLNYITGAYNGLVDFFEEHNLLEQEQVQLFLNSIDEGVKRISSIVKRLNQFSHSSRKFDEVCDVNLIIENCIYLLGNEVKQRIDIQKEFSSESMIISGNSGKLHQAFFNILLNSAQAIKDKGIINIKTEKKNGKIIVTIKDNGCGISKENINRIMEPFFTTKPPGQGVGLGLSIAYSIIKEHKGTIVFDSEEGKGTMVIITFPIRKDNLI